jgi:hypothetical protein
MQLLPVKTTAPTTLHQLAVSYLSSQLQLDLWTEGTKYYSQASHLNFKLLWYLLIFFFCIINFTISILFLPTSLSLFFQQSIVFPLNYTLCTFSSTLPVFTSPSYPSPTHHHTTPSTHSPPAD